MLHVFACDARVRLRPALLEFAHGIMSAPSSPPAAPVHAPTASVHANRTVGLGAWSAALALVVSLCALDRFVLHTQVLTSFRGHPAQSPLYAFWMPVLRPAAIGFVALSVGWVVLAPALCDPQRSTRTRFLCAFAAASALFPLALFAAREDLGALGANLNLYRNEEFVHDAQKIALMRDAQGRTGVPVFLEHYVEAMPQLSLHGQHFPPGHALWAFAVQRVFGPSATAQALAVLGAFVLAATVSFFALRTLLDEAAARQAALLCLCAPSMLDFACTSMDAVFLLWAALAWLAGVRALRAQSERPSLGIALATGALLGVAALASFAALFVALALLLNALESPRRRRSPWSQTWRALSAIGAGFALFLVVFWFATGFAWWDCLQHARTSGLELMTRILKGPPTSRWLELSVGNLGAFLLGGGVALVAATLATHRVAGSAGVENASRSWTIAALSTLALMSFGGLFFMETERIWLFSVPWLAACAVTPAAWSARTLRGLLAVALVQSLLAEALLFTLW